MKTLIKSFWEHSANQFALCCGLIFGPLGLMLLIGTFFSTNPEDNINFFVSGLMILVSVAFIAFGWPKKKPETPAVEKN